MCHDDDSRAPAPPVRGEVAAHGGLELTSADGTVFPALEATPAGFAAGGSRDRAAAGRPRPAPLRPSAATTSNTGRTSTRSTRPTSGPTRPRRCSGCGPGPAPGRCSRSGFCFGGSQSWRLSAGDLDLSGVIGFYGRPSLVEDVLDQLHLPMLLLVAGADVATSPERSEEAPAHRAGRRARAGRLRGRAALLLRPLLRRMEGRRHRLLAPNPRLRRRPRLGSGATRVLGRDLEVDQVGVDG